MERLQRWYKEFLCNFYPLFPKVNILHSHNAFAKLRNKHPKLRN